MGARGAAARARARKRSTFVVVVVKVDLDLAADFFVVLVIIRSMEGKERSHGCEQRARERRACLGGGK